MLVPSKRRRTRKPNHPVRAVSQHKPDNLLLFNGNLHDDYSSNAHSLIGGASYTQGKGGRGLNSRTLQHDGASLDNYTAGDKTFIIVFERKVSATSTTNQNKVQILIAGGSTTILEVNAGNGFGAGGDIDKPRIAASGAANVKAFIDGASYTSVDPVPLILNNNQVYTMVITGEGFDTSTIHQLGADASNYSLAGNIYFYTMLPYKVSDAEAVKLSINANRLLQPRTQYINIVAAAPPAGAIMNQLQGSNMGADLFNGTLL